MFAYAAYKMCLASCGVGSCAIEMLIRKKRFVFVAKPSGFSFCRKLCAVDWVRFFSKATNGFLSASDLPVAGHEVILPQSVGCNDDRLTELSLVLGRSDSLP